MKHNIIAAVFAIVIIILIILSINAENKETAIHDAKRKTTDSCILEKVKMVNASQKDVDSLHYWETRLETFHYSDKEFKKYKIFYTRVNFRSEAMDKQAKRLDSIFNIANK